jgi:pimeloyl-ACP methyl ester carboxylesterase
MVSPTQLSVVRMVPVAGRIARAARGRLAVYRLLNSSRGWDAHHTPVQDVGWALDELRGRHPGLDFGLVGHSLGGRAALLAGAGQGVRAVVALNPWIHPADTVDLTGRRVLVVHGLQDRVALPSRSAELARRLARRTEVEYVELPDAGHAMLRRAGEFERRAAVFVVETLLDDRPGQRASERDPAEP